MLIRGYTVRQPRQARTRNGFEGMIDTMLSDVGQAASRMFETNMFPPVNMWEDAQAVYVEAELPGFDREQIELSIVNDELVLSGSREPVTAEKASYLRRERRIGRFNRTIPLPTEINADKVEAALNDGVLRITLPKADAAQPRKIEVKAG